MAEDKPNPYKQSVSSTFDQMSGGSVVGAADRSDGNGPEGFPILVHTDQGPVVLKLADDCSGDYNAWAVRGEIPEPPFPTDVLFSDSRYTLDAIEEADLTIRGTQTTLSVRSGTVPGCDIDSVEAMMRWSEIGRR